jgi:colanic acid biosynthesis protein WcaH
MTAPRLPNDSDFARIVRHAPLVSIDVLLKDPEEYVLLGLRVNEPARGKYFVPGGVIRKNERLRDAFSRILKAELGLKIAFEDARFLGVFEHFYETNRYENSEFGL